jgi:peptidoglycan/xylan/chitin deacetylase (PgdA/CDA1 family)
VPLLERLALPATFFLVPDLLSRETEAWWEVTAWAFTAATRGVLEWEGASYSLATPAARRRSYEAVAERLKRRDERARRASVPDLVERLAPVGPRPAPDLFLDWQGAAALVARGFAVGSHTSCHAILAQETREAQEADLRRARDQLSRRLATDVDVLAYPNGTRADYDTATMAAAAAAGHRAAVTTVDGFAGPDTRWLELPRSVVYPERGPLDLALALRAAWRGSADLT